MELARNVIEAASSPSSYRPLYDLELPLKEKIETVAKKIYGADEIQYAPAAEKALAEIAALGGDKLPICVAKTQYSLSDDAKALGRPKGFTLHVRDARVSAGAGFVVIYTGNILQMPGLPKKPAAEQIDIDANGIITGLF